MRMMRARMITKMIGRKKQRMILRTRKTWMIMGIMMKRLIIMTRDKDDNYDGLDEEKDDIYI